MPSRNHGLFIKFSLQHTMEHAENMVIHTGRLTTRVSFTPDGERMDISLLWVAEY